MNLARILCIFAVAILCVGCAAKKIATVQMPFAAVKSKVVQMRPAIGPDGKPCSKVSREEVPGTRFKHWLREPGAEGKFEPSTTVTVSRVDDTTTTVELATTKYVLLMGPRHLYFTERRRWKELQEILHE